jgi:zinc transporter 9
MEDSAALVGVLVASGSLFLSHSLNLWWVDCVGSISIGMLLSSVAVFLIKRNLQGLIQTRMDPEKELEIVRILEADPIVKSVHDIKSTSVGPDWARFKAEILFDGKEVARRYQSLNPHKVSQEIEILRGLQSDEDIQKWTQDYGNELLLLLGKEIDRLETMIQSARPEVKHIDLEIL